MKKTLLSTLILALAPNVLLASTSTTDLNQSSKSERLLPPVSLKLSETLDTNFSKSSGKSDPTLSHEINASTSFSKELTSQLTLKDSPEMNLEYIPIDESDNTTFIFDNTLSLSYKLSERSRISTESTQGYLRKFDFNDQQEFTKQEYYYLSLEPSFSRDFGKSFSVSGYVGVLVEDYTTPTSVSQPDESDNMTTYMGGTPSYKPNDNVTISLPIYTEKWRARTRKSLLANGQPGGKKAEEQDYTKFSLKAAFTQGDLTITPSVGFHKNRDLEFGAKDYDGNVLMMSLSYSADKFSYYSYLLTKSYNYSSQLTNPYGEETTPLYEYSRLKVYNSLSFPKAVFGGDLGFSHTMEQYSSNRDSVNFINQSFNLKLTFTL